MTHRSAEYGPRAALHWSEIHEVTSRARAIMNEYPPAPFGGNAQRGDRLRMLADDYAINVRTLYRYLRFGALTTVRVGAWSAVFTDRDDSAPVQVGGWINDDEQDDDDDVPA